MAVLSIRHKVIISVTAIYVFMAVSGLGAYCFMLRLEEKIGNLENVSKLEEAVLEMRRFEKNFLLYKDKQSHKTTLYYLAKARALMEKNIEKLGALSSPQEVARFSNNLQEYEKIMTVCETFPLNGNASSSRADLPECESRTRTLGTSMVNFAEEIILRKRQSIKETLGTTIKLQMVAFVIVAVGVMTTGTFLFTKVLKPLERLEENTERIAKGFFEPIGDLPLEREVRDIFESFNRMTRELQIREEQLLQSKKLASLGTMLAGVAHEVNNPLSNISSSCEILLEDLDESDKEWQRGLLNKVLEQVDKARVIVRDLLEFSRANEFFKESFKLKDMLERTIRLCRGQIPSDVIVSTQIDADLTLFAERNRMQQAFMNLITNAVQANEGGGQVKIAAYDNHDGMIAIVVRDTGHGIPEAALPNIFDPFFYHKGCGTGHGPGALYYSRYHRPPRRHYKGSRVSRATGLRSP